MQFQENQEVTFKGRNYTITNVSRGWHTLRNSDGDTVKARAKELEPAVVREMKSQLSNARKRYEKTKSYGGEVSYDNGDEVAELLRGLEPQDVCTLADFVLDTESGFHLRRYRHLNPGQQRMNAGNRIRSAIKKRAETRRLLLSELSSRGHTNWMS
ncbi:MAG: hypothetical protein AAF756_15160 [Pseudomonadota bacterium]